MFFAIIFMGLLQGITEFLPVSSSGHLVLFGRIFNISESLFISIVLHVATLFSIIWVYRKQIGYLIVHPFSKGTQKLFFATLPTCLIVLIILPLVEKAFLGNFLPFCFMISAFILVLSSLIISKKPSKIIYINDNDFSGITLKHAFFMGVAQGFAVFPGISRSGSTICAGVLSGADRNSVADFSFLMSLPIIILSLFKEIYEISTSQSALNIDVLSLIISCVVAFVVGVFAIKFMVKITKKVSFVWFGVYLFIISVLSFVLI